MLIDAHCHINCLSLSQIENLVSCGQDNRFIDSSTNYESSLKSLKLSKAHSFIYSSLGFHPFWAKEFHRTILEDYKKLIDSSLKVIAIGEVGLDEKADATLALQEEIFESFIDLARSKNLALILHNRLNSFRILEILDGSLSSYEKVIFHCFSHSKDLLEKILQKKGWICFSLNILRKKKELLEALRACPLERMLLETDSPYMRIGQRPSEPLDINEVYSFVASFRNLSVEELSQIVFANAQNIFGLK